MSSVPWAVNHTGVPGARGVGGGGERRRGTVQEGAEDKSRQGRKCQFREFENLERVCRDIPSFNFHIEHKHTIPSLLENQS